MTTTYLHTADPDTLRAERTSIKWAEVAPDVLPMFIAEMDFTVDEGIRRAIADQALRSDLGYSGNLDELYEAFGAFARVRWGWNTDPAHFEVAPDVSFGVKAALRHVLPRNARVALTTPVYPSFFHYLEDLGAECVEIPLIGEGDDMHIDIDALDAAFSAPEDTRVHGLILANPHNPHGIAHSPEILEALARSAAAHGAFIVADEIHAPLTHHGVTFTPFSPIAAKHGTQSVTVTSASKGWNIAGTKCALVYAPPETASESLRHYLDVALNFSGGILGRTASTIAFRDAVGWIDAAISQIETNVELLTTLIDEQLPGAKLVRPKTSYLAWLDLRDAGLGDDPWHTLQHEAKVLTNDGRTFGRAGVGHVRMNIGCDPEIIREAIARIAAVAKR